jgi:phosphatidylglycerophosphate synthase
LAENPRVVANRRPLEVRRQPWVHKLAHILVRIGITPNQISLASVGFAAVGAIAYVGSTLTEGFPRIAFLVASAALIQMRLLANLLDGIMAVEEGGKTPAGPVYNEFPDRVADSLFLVAAGYASGWSALGWVAALLAAIIAYIRLLGGSLGLSQDFCGPMAKQHRMAALCAGSIAAAFLANFPILALTLIAITAGSLITIFRRIRHIAAALDAEHGIGTGSND